MEILIVVAGFWGLFMSIFHISESCYADAKTMKNLFNAWAPCVVLLLLFTLSTSMSVDNITLTEKIDARVTYTKNDMVYDVIKPDSINCIVDIQTVQTLSMGDRTSHESTFAKRCVDITDVDISKAKLKAFDYK